LVENHKTNLLSLISVRLTLIDKYSGQRKKFRELNTLIRLDWIRAPAGSVYGLARAWVQTGVRRSTAQGMRSEQDGPTAISRISLPADTLDLGSLTQKSSVLLGRKLRLPRHLLRRLSRMAFAVAARSRFPFRCQCRRRRALRQSAAVHTGRLRRLAARQGRCG
jgi:hypothetical protein